MADLIAVNKADEDRKLPAQQARAAYQRALHLFPPKSSGWIAKALTCSALKGAGLQDILQEIKAFQAHTADNGYFSNNRQAQAIHWFEQQLQERILEAFLSGNKRQVQLSQLRDALRAGTISPQAAVDSLFIQDGSTK